MSFVKNLIKYFIAGAVGGLLGGYISMFIPQLNIVPIISVASGIGAAIIGLILDRVIKN